MLYTLPAMPYVVCRRLVLLVLYHVNVEEAADLRSTQAVYNFLAVNVATKLYPWSSSGTSAKLAQVVGLCYPTSLKARMRCIRPIASALSE